VQVMVPGYHERPRIRRALNNPDEIAAAAKRIAGVDAVALRAEAFVLASGEQRSRGLMITGIDPDAERAMSLIPKQMETGRYLRAGERGSAIIGSLAAESLQLEVGDECVFIGSGKDGSIAASAVQIVGMYKTGIDSFDRSTMQIPLTEFDEVFSMNGAVHRVVITVDHLAAAGSVVSGLEHDGSTDGLSVMSWDMLNPGLRQSIELDLIGGVIMYVILVIVVAFSILNTFFMAIFERKREFGVLMAIGMKPLRLVKLMLLESMSMTVIGLVLGMLFGILATMAGAHWGIGLGDSSEFMAQYGVPERLYPKLTPLSLVLGPVLICIVTFITALIPVLRIPRMRPVEALRS